MTDQLTIPGAAETALRVELTTLTVEGRRLTRAVYTQLREEPLIGDDGTLNGKPWGYVNEHLKGGVCGRFRGLDAHGRFDHTIDRGHRHVIWQRGDELLRDLVFSLSAAERTVVHCGNGEFARAWDAFAPYTVPVRRRAHNLVAGLPQIFIGR